MNVPPCLRVCNKTNHPGNSTIRVQHDLIMQPDATRHTVNGRADCIGQGPYRQGIRVDLRDDYGLTL